MKIKGIIFDLDGTLANTLEDLKYSLNMAMKELSLPLHNDESVLNCLNNGMKVFIQRAVPEGLRTSEMLAKVAERYHHYYSLNYMDKTCFYDGINPLLQALKNEYGIKIAVLSNKDDIYTKNIIKTLDIAKSIDAAYGFSDGIPLKPDPQNVFNIMNKFGLTCDEVILVGDSEVDVNTAQNAGIISVGALWGFKGEDAFNAVQPRYKIEKPIDLIKIIQEMD